MTLLHVEAYESNVEAIEVAIWNSRPIEIVNLHSIFFYCFLIRIIFFSTDREFTLIKMV